MTTHAKKRRGKGICTRFRNIEPDFSLAHNTLYERIRKHEPRSTNKIPLTWHKAKGFSVSDERGNTWIDLTSGIFVANAGHANPKIKQAVMEQLNADLLFTYNYPTRIKERFESALLRLSPKHLNTVALVNSGSEAMALAHKLIKVYGKKKGKKYIVTFKGSYHGRGLSSEMISGNKEKAAWSGVKDDGIVFLDFPYDPKTPFDSKKLPAPKNIAGFVIETFQGWGAWFYPKSFIRDLAAFAKKNRALVCFDEMQSGFYRLGPLYGYQTYGSIKPDILALGKGISSSLPIAATLARRSLFDTDARADLYGTHSGNPVSCAAALASLEFLSSAQEIARRKKTTSLFERELKSLEHFPQIKCINVRGLVAGIIFKETSEATAVVLECIRRGVLPVCTNRESIKIGPPLTITAHAIREAIGVIREILSERSQTPS
ncbi:MAG: aspartate aminotransferase family protein [bacterium]|nr:aspartate aminotransferase family protein [bacterium]